MATVGKRRFGLDWIIHKIWEKVPQQPKLKILVDAIQLGGGVDLLVILSQRIFSAERETVGEQLCGELSNSLQAWAP